MDTRHPRKISVVHNKNYRPSGTKSYVRLLRKYGFEPTLPGPYLSVNRVAQLDHAGMSVLSSEVDGSATQARVLAKKTNNGDAHVTEVTAEDQQNDQMYLVPVSIGTPPQKFMLDFDTGSSDLWLWSNGLPASIKSQSQGHNIFDPSKSSTFKKMDGCSWNISYGDTSNASGIVGTDVVTIGGLTIKNQAIELATNMSDEFIQSTGDGVLGLAWGQINGVKPLHVSTPVQNMLDQGDISESSELFTVYLRSWKDAKGTDKGESFYTFGYIDEQTLAKSKSEIHWTPVDNSQGFWAVSSGSVTVNGTTVDRPGNTAIMDTGTTLALVSDATCHAIYNAIPGSFYDPTLQGYVFPNNLREDQLPAVTFAVGDKQITLRKEDLGFVDADEGFIYGGIQSRGTMAYDILGDAFLRCIYAIFDQRNQRFGAVPKHGETET